MVPKQWRATSVTTLTNWFCRVCTGMGAVACQKSAGRAGEMGLRGEAAKGRKILKIFSNPLTYPQRGL